MSTSPFPPEEFSVLHFALMSSEEGKPAQKTQICGTYPSVEEAFISARLCAIREWQRLRVLAPAGISGAPIHWQVIDTEWGYDLKRDTLVVSRFWIHARPIMPKF